MRAMCSRLDGGVVVRTSRGTEFEAKLVHAGRKSLVFEAYGPEPVVQVGEQLSDVSLLRGGATVYAGPARVEAMLSTGPSLIVTAAPQGTWAADEPAKNNAPAATALPSLHEDADALVRRWREGQRLLPAFQLAVHNVRSFLAQLSAWIAPIDAGMESSDPAERAQVADGIFTRVRGEISDLFTAYEAAAAQVPPDQMSRHRAFAQRELHPFLLCAPLFHRGLTKPLGYAGDYEMVNMLLRNGMEGPTVYAMVVNGHFLKMDISEGHRNRIEKLVDILRREATRAFAEGRRLRVLNVGCGPVEEVGRFIEREPLLAGACEFTLVDFNAETLGFAQRRIERAVATAGRPPVDVRFVQRSVNDLLKDAGRYGRIEAFGAQDLIYCAGLFDYLSGKVCQRLLACFLGTAEPGGAVVATNVHPRHSSRSTLEDLGEWPLILRDEGEMAALAPDGAAEMTSETEVAGTNVFLEFRRPVTAAVSETTSATTNACARGTTTRCIATVGGVPAV